MTDKAPSLARIEGARLALRLIEPSDAEYVYGLRTDPAMNTHLSEVRGIAEDQRNWIIGYKNRERAGTEYYYVIERLSDGERCGLVRLYDIASDSFTWGSWMLDGNKPPKAALESAVQIYRIGFGLLGCNRAVFDVRKDNLRTLAFHRRFGAEEIGADYINAYFEYSRQQFEEVDLPRYQAVLMIK